MSEPMRIITSAPWMVGAAPGQSCAYLSLVSSFDYLLAVLACKIWPN
jgi:hypothetical protein